MAYTSVSQDNYKAYLKMWYMDKKKLHVMDIFDAKLFGLMEKRTDAGGGDPDDHQWRVVVPDASPVGRSGDYTDSYNNSNPGSDTKFVGDWKEAHASLFINDKVIRLAKGSAGAMIGVLEKKLGPVKQKFIQGTEYQLFRDEGGSVGQVSAFTAGGTGGTITWNTNSAAAVTRYLTEGTILTVSAQSDGTSLRTTVWKVDGTSDKNGTTHITPYASSGSDVPAASDYVYIQGDEGNALCGLGSWCPKSDPTSTVFKGVDRTTNARALGGIRLDATGISKVEAFIQAGDQAASYGAKMSVIMVNPTTYSLTKQELQSLQRFSGPGYKLTGSPAVKGGTKGMSAKDAAKFSFSALALDGTDRPCVLVSNWACPADVSYAVELDSFWFESVGPWPSFRDLDGLGNLFRTLTATSNDYAHQILGYGEALCSAPGHQVCVIHK